MITTIPLVGRHHAYIEGILPKGSYPPCLRMANRTLLAGYPRYRRTTTALVGQHHVYWKNNSICLQVVASFLKHVRMVSWHFVQITQNLKIMVMCLVMANIKLMWNTEMGIIRGCVHTCFSIFSIPYMLPIYDCFRYSTIYFSEN